MKLEYERVGKYKTAVEGFAEREMSDANREMSDAILDSMHGPVPRRHRRVARA